MIEGQPTPADTVTDPVATADIVTESAKTEAPESIVNPDGTFVEGWHSKLKNEALRKDETLPRFKKLEDLANSYVNVRKQVPMDKVVLPTETSPPEVWDEFYKATGRPDVYTPVEVPLELKEYYEDPLVAEATAELHKGGLSQKQFDLVMALDKKRIEYSIAQKAEVEKRELDEADTALKAKWGVDYPSKLHLANKMISENTESGEQRDTLLKYIGNNPFVAEFLAEIAGKFVEHGVITDVGIPSSDDLATIEQKIKELQAKEGYGKKMHPDHKFIIEQLSKLFKERDELNKKLQTTS